MTLVLKLALTLAKTVGGMAVNAGQGNQKALLTVLDSDLLGTTTTAARWSPLAATAPSWSTLGGFIVSGTAPLVGARRPMSMDPFPSRGRPVCVAQPSPTARSVPRPAALLRKVCADGMASSAGEEMAPDHLSAPLLESGIGTTAALPTRTALRARQAAIGAVGMESCVDPLTAMANPTVAQPHQPGKWLNGVGQSN